ncbi:MAG: HU family DNA-binding protein [Patescibacteria group bacterium]|nr:HU family DNA-binding protein [Patescibacteria group bacterium]
MNGGAEKKKASKSMTKSAIVSELASSTELTKKQIEGVLLALYNLAVKEVKRNGKFTIPDLVMLHTKHKKATEAHETTMHIGPRAGQRVMVPAKPAKTVVRAKPAGAFKKSWA